MSYHFPISDQKEVFKWKILYQGAKIPAMDQSWMIYLQHHRRLLLAQLLARQQKTASGKPKAVQKVQEQAQHFLWKRGKASVKGGPADGTAESLCAAIRGPATKYLWLSATENQAHAYACALPELLCNTKIKLFDHPFSPFLAFLPSYHVLFILSTRPLCRKAYLLKFNSRTCAVRRNTIH